MHDKSVPMYVTTLGAETFSRGTPEVFLQIQGHNTCANIVAVPTDPEGPLAGTHDC